MGLYDSNGYAIVFGVSSSEATTGKVSVEGEGQSKRIVSGDDFYVGYRRTLYEVRREKAAETIVLTTNDSARILVGHSAQVFVERFPAITDHVFQATIGIAQMVDRTEPPLASKSLVRTYTGAVGPRSAFVLGDSPLISDVRRGTTWRVLTDKSRRTLAAYFADVRPDRIELRVETITVRPVGMPLWDRIRLFWGRLLYGHVLTSV